MKVIFHGHVKSPQGTFPAWFPLDLHVSYGNLRVSIDCMKNYYQLPEGTIYLFNDKYHGFYQ